MILPVTVIITVFKRTDYLKNAIESVLAQTSQPLEIIVTDDSSSAAVKAICDSFKTPIMRYRTNIGTLGVALNLRAAIEEARGKYIAILNDDDFWGPDYLNKLVAPLEADQNRILSFGDHYIVSVDGQIDKKKSDENTVHYGRSSLSEGEVPDLVDFVLKKNGIPLAMACIFRRDAFSLDLLNKNVTGAYDFWISCLLAASGKAAYYVPERLSYYRVHGSIKAKWPGKALAGLLITFLPQKIRTALILWFRFLKQSVCF